MDGNYFKAKKLQVLPEHILRRRPKKPQVSEGGRTEKKRTPNLQHIPICSYIFP